MIVTSIEAYSFDYGEKKKETAYIRLNRKGDDFMAKSLTKLASGSLLAAMLLAGCGGEEPEEQKPVMEEPTDNLKEDEDNGNQEGQSTEKNAENKGAPDEGEQEDDMGIDQEDVEIEDESEQEQ